MPVPAIRVVAQFLAIF